MSWFRRKRPIPEGMADLHNHIIPGIDDGARDSEESVAMLRMFEESGFSLLVATSHLGHPLFPEVRSEEIRAGVTQVNALAKEHGIAIEVRPGAEIYYGDEFLDRYQKGEFVTLGDEGSYMLIEFPPSDPMPHLKRLGFELGVKGIRPVLAHPERYEVLLDRPQLAKEWVRAGWTLQLDLPSLTGESGRLVKKLAFKMLRQGVFDLAASDLHRCEPPEALADMMQALVKEVGLQEATRLMVTNPHRMVLGQNIVEVRDDHG